MSPLGAVDEPSALAPTPVVDADHPGVRRFAASRTEGAATELERAVRLYYAVRDEIRYDPYGAAVTPETLRASATLASGRGWCVSKAVVLVAACRALGIPSRLGFADVRNHLSTARMREHMKTDVFYWHGYASLRLEGRWVKATPAFNIELCEKFGLLPLDFDGRVDSLYHAFDRQGRRHMEYLSERGEFEDVPLDAMLATFAKEYPGLGLGAEEATAAFGAEADFDRDVEAETPGVVAQGGALVSDFVPRGWPRVVPRLFVDDPRGFVEFVRQVFDATGEYHAERPSELRIGDSLLMVAGPLDRGHHPGFLYVYVEDADAIWRRALDRGATSIEDPTDLPYGDRRATVRDSWGCTWQIATHSGRFTP